MARAMLRAICLSAGTLACKLNPALAGFSISDYACAGYMMRRAERAPTATALLYLFEGHADPVPLDPEDSAVEHDAAMLGHKSKPIREVMHVRHIDRRPISGYIYDITAAAHSITTYSRGMIDFCPRLPILDHDEHQFEPALRCATSIYSFSVRNDFTVR